MRQFKDQYLYDRLGFYLDTLCKESPDTFPRDLEVYFKTRTQVFLGERSVDLPGDWTVGNPTVLPLLRAVLKPRAPAGFVLDSNGV